MEWGPDNTRGKVSGPSWLYWIVAEGWKDEGYEKHTQEEVLDWNK